MPHLRLALAAGGLLLAVPVLSSCGFDYPTERLNTVGAGVTVRDATVDVGGALVVAGQPDSGTLIGTLSNNDNDEAISLTSVSGGEKGEIEASDFDPIEVAAGGHVNLAALEDDAITVTGDFDAGDFVTATFTFNNNETVTVEIPVMKPCYQFEDLDVSDATPSTDPLYSCDTTGGAEESAEH